MSSGERVGLSGESGCGKTTLLKAVAGLLPANAQSSGTCIVTGAAGYIPQEGTLSLSPFLKVGTQVTNLNRSAAGNARLFALVGLEAPRYRDSYPHQLSGGERQRILTIQALACKPTVILADEPTAHLDPESEAAILKLISDYARETAATLLVASHRARVFQMLGCKVHDMGSSLDASPPREAAPARPPGRSLVSIRHLSKTHYRKDWLMRSIPAAQALDDVSLEIAEGEAVALVGRSGAGKSTLARCLAGRDSYDSGSIEWQVKLAGPDRAQLVQQDPSESLNPRFTISQAIAEACDTASADLLSQINLPPQWFHRSVSALSEGQRARVAILRSASRLEQGLLILDESLSGLDSITRRNIISFVRCRQAEHGLAVLLVTHDREAVHEFGCRIVELESGRIIMVTDALRA